MLLLFELFLFTLFKDIWTGEGEKQQHTGLDTNKHLPSPEKIIRLIFFFNNKNEDEYGF